MQVVVRVQPIEVIVGLSDDLALELLTTWAIPAPGADVIELIGDGAAYLDWSTRAGLIDDQDKSVIRDAFSAGEFDDIAGAARGLRDRLRPALLAWTNEPSAPIPSPLIDELNTVLATGHRYAQLHTNECDLRVRDHRRWGDPTQLLVPPAEAWAR